MSSSSSAHVNPCSNLLEVESLFPTFATAWRQNLARLFTTVLVYNPYSTSLESNKMSQPTQAYSEQPIIYTCTNATPTWILSFLTFMLPHGEQTTRPFLTHLLRIALSLESGVSTATSIRRLFLTVLVYNPYSTSLESNKMYHL